MQLPLEKLCGGMFSDELDKLGYRNQVAAGFTLNTPGLRLLGAVRTVLLETIETPDENIRVGLSFLEALSPGEVLCVQGSHEFAYFGELMSRLSIRQRLGGVVIDGLTRDTVFTRGLTELPIYARGYSPRDIKGRGRVAGVDRPITIGSVRVSPGDWVFADGDGVVFIPAAVRTELTQRLGRVIDAEADIIARIDRGASIDDILSSHNEF